VTRRDFKQAIAAAKVELGRVEMPAPVAHRVLRNVKRAGRRGGPGLALGGLALAGACAVALLSIVGRRPAPPAVVAGAAQLPDGFESVRTSPDLQLDVARAGSRIGVRSGSCTLRVTGWGQVTLQTGASFAPVEGGVELSRGEADFEVDKRAPGAGSTFVRVPQGTIEITGTRFRVSEGVDGGTVHLDEGAIRFHAPDGRTVALTPGQSLTWPLPPPPSAPPSEDAPPPGAPPAPGVSRTSSGASAVLARPTGKTPRPPARVAPEPAVQAAQEGAVDATAALVERIADLRAEGRYDELARELRTALARETRPLTRERLSFELGSVLSYHLTDRAAACAHWAAHRRAFPEGRYAQEISDVEASIRCTAEGSGP
jgi:transmembrane sensor